MNTSPVAAFTPDTEERWVPAPGFEDRYLVSSEGRVKRLAPGAGARLGRLLTPTVTAKGYLRVELRSPTKRKAIYVQRLVLSAFTGDSPEEVARHLNGKRTDNRLCNLAWGSELDNFNDAIEHGTINRDEAGRFTPWEEEFAW